MDMSIFRDGRAYFRISGVKGLISTILFVLVVNINIAKHDKGHMYETTLPMQLYYINKTDYK